MNRGIYVPEHAAMKVEHAGEKYRPSNGHEGELFECNYCTQCKKDDDGRCRIFMLTLIHDTDEPEYPSEWQYGQDGQPTCTAFEPRGDAPPTAERDDMMFRDMTNEQVLAWGAAEAEARKADLAVRTREGLIAAQENAKRRRNAIGASDGQAANAVTDALRAKASRARPGAAVVSGWQPIETAPRGRNAPSVLLACAGTSIPIYCGRHRGGNRGEPQELLIEWRCDSSGRFANPTHWQTLPPPPEQDGAP